MEVSVLSGLARSDLDPWHEAAKLAGLPGKTATERLAMIVEAVPGKAWARAEATAAAARLVALLPQARADDVSMSRVRDSLGTMVKSRSWLVYAILISFVLGSQLVIAIERQSSATQPGDTRSPDVVAPTQPSVNSGQ